MTYNAVLTMSSEIPLADWTKAISRSALQDMLAATARPDLLSFALGLPAGELFPTEKYAQSLMRVLSNDPRALQYGPPLQRLKQQVLAIMELRGVHCREVRALIGGRRAHEWLRRVLHQAPSLGRGAAGPRDVPGRSNSSDLARRRKPPPLRRGDFGLRNRTTG